MRRACWLYRTTGIVFGLALSATWGWPRPAYAQGSAGKAPVPTTPPVVGAPSTPGAGTVPELPVVTASNVMQTVEAYIQQETADGPFRMYDVQAKEELFLTFERIEEGPLYALGADEFLAHARFTSEAGKAYELDYFVRGTSPATLRVVPERTRIHQVDGAARYEWELDSRRGIYIEEEVALAEVETEETGSVDGRDPAVAD